MASLFQACKAAVRNKQGGTFNIGGYDIDIEMYSQQDINDDVEHNDVIFGDNDESKIVLVADDTITIPANYTLTPDSPKKSLVIYCNNLINNGTISMYQKAPNVLPHDFYIIQGNLIGSNRNLIIPAYANNSAEETIAKPSTALTDAYRTLKKGIDGTNHNCGSGGLGMSGYWSTSSVNGGLGMKSGSGHAFGGGAGSGSAVSNTNGEFAEACSVDTIYPMHGGNGNQSSYPNSNQFKRLGGVGYPSGLTNATELLTPINNSGCGGRIIIFCSNFTNNGNIVVDGTETLQAPPAKCGIGGASGAGAIDLFYATLVEQGTLSANGGLGAYANGINPSSATCGQYAGAGGDGSITLTQWNLDKVIKEERKMFTKDNWVYLFSNYSQRLREDVI